MKNKEIRIKIIQYVCAFMIPVISFTTEWIKPETKTNYKVEFFIVCAAAWLLYKFGPRYQEMRGMAGRNPEKFMCGFMIIQTVFALSELFEGFSRNIHVQETILSVYLGTICYYNLMGFDIISSKKKDKKSASEKIKQLCEQMLAIHPNSLPVPARIKA